MIPARLGSKRLPRKNLRPVGGVSLLARAIRLANLASVFDEVWVSSESPIFGEIAEKEGARFHHRPENLATDDATSEDFVADFMSVCDASWLVQLHSIAPLLSVGEIKSFVGCLTRNDADTLFTVVRSKLEVLYEDTPLNFSFDLKQNSQELSPVWEIVWAMTGWKRNVYLDAYDSGECATYAGRKSYFELDHVSAHVVKTELDLAIAEALLPVAMKRGQYSEK